MKEKLQSGWETDYGPGLSWSMSRLTLLIKEYQKQLTKIPSFLLSFAIPFWGKKKKKKKKCMYVCILSGGNTIRCPLSGGNQIQDVLWTSFVLGNYRFGFEKLLSYL